MTVVEQGFRTVTSVPETEYGDPIPWKDKCSPLIFVGADGSLACAGRYVDDRRQILERATHEEGVLLFAWAGRYSTDVFVVDDLARANKGLTGRGRA